MKLSIVETRRFFDRLEKTLDSETELKFDVIYALNKTRNQLKGTVNEISDMVTLLNKKERSLSLKYCARDENDSPIIRDDRYIGLEPGVCEEYDTEIEKLQDERREYFRKEIDVPIHFVDKELVPKKGKAFVIETLCFFVKKCEETEKKKTTN